MLPLADGCGAGAVYRLTPFLPLFLLFELFLHDLLCWPPLFALIDPLCDELGRIKLDIEARDGGIGWPIKCAAAALRIGRNGSIWPILRVRRAVRIAITSVIIAVRLVGMVR